MASLTPSDSWDNVYQIETSDPVQGGTGGITNTPHQNNTNRTERIKETLNLVGIDVENKLINKNRIEFVDSLADLQALTGMAEDDVVYISGRTTPGDGGQGHFVWVLGDYTTQVTADALSGIYAPSDADSDGSDGCWIRQHDGVAHTKWFGVKADGATDDTAAYRACAALINSGLVKFSSLIFDPGESILFTSTTGALIALSDIDGLNIQGYGCLLTVDRTKPIVASEGYFFSLSGCKNITIDGFSTDGPVLDITQTAVKGYEFVRLWNGCENISIPTARIKNSLLGVAIGHPTLDGSNVSRNINIGTIDVEHCWYGVIGQFYAEDVIIDNLITDGVHRSCIMFGNRGIRANIHSKDHYAIDVQIATSKGVGMSDVYLNYYSGIDSINCGDSPKVRLDITGGDIAPSSMENIHINLNVDYASSGSTGGPALIFQKSLADGSVDTNSSRGHILKDIYVTGKITGSPSYTGYGATIVFNPNVGTGWDGGDTFSNLVFENLQLENNILRMYLGSLVDHVTLRNVATTAWIDIHGNYSTNTRLPTVGKTILDNVSCANRYEYSTVQPLDNLRQVSTTGTVYPGWSGKTIGNLGAGGTSTWTLSTATVGLEYTFVRNDAQIMDIDPDGTDVIRGGTAGQIYRTNTAGSTLHIKCYIDGYWEIVSQSGTWAFI